MMTKIAEAVSEQPNLARRVENLLIPRQHPYLITNCKLRKMLSLKKSSYPLNLFTRKEQTYAIL